MFQALVLVLEQTAEPPSQIKIEKETIEKRPNRKREESFNHESMDQGFELYFQVRVSCKHILLLVNACPAHIHDSFSLNN